VVMRRGPDGRRRVHQIGVLDGNPVTPQVVWDADHGPGDGYDELLRDLGVA